MSAVSETRSKNLTSDDGHQQPSGSRAILKPTYLRNKEGFFKKEFFSRYRVFIVITITDSQTEANHKKSCELVEFEIQLLIKALERSGEITQASYKSLDVKELYHLESMPISGDEEVRPPVANATRFFVGLEVPNPRSLNGRTSTELTLTFNRFWDEIYHTIPKEGVTMESCSIKRYQLGPYLDVDALERHRKPMEGLAALLAKHRAMNGLKDPIPIERNVGLSKRSHGASTSADVEVTSALEKMSIGDGLGPSKRSRIDATTDDQMAEALKTISLSKDTV